MKTSSCTMNKEGTPDMWEAGEQQTVGTVGSLLGVSGKNEGSDGGSQADFSGNTPKTAPTVPTVSPAGIVTVQAQWGQAIRLAVAGFERDGTSYAEPGLHGAAWLEASNAFEWELPIGIDADLVNAWLRWIYTGRANVRLSEQGRPVLNLSVQGVAL